MECFERMIEMYSCKVSATKLSKTQCTMHARAGGMCTASRQALEESQETA